MSEVPNEAGPIFEATSTPNIDRANRLIALRAYPGFNDVIRMSQELVQESIDKCNSYPGWDDKVIIALAIRQKAAAEYREALLTKINLAIEIGVSEARALLSSLPAKTVDEVIDQGDLVRQRVLENFAEQDNRPAGSY